MLELQLVALYRPGWLVPNSADTVKAKALHQERNLCGSYLSKFRKEIWAVQCLASLRGESEGTTPQGVAETCPTCSAVLDTPTRCRAHLEGVSGSRGRSACDRLADRVASNRRAGSYWLSRLTLAIKVLLPYGSPAERQQLASALHRAIRAYDYDPASVAFAVLAESLQSTDAGISSEEGIGQVDQAQQDPFSAEQILGEPIADVVTPPEERLFYSGWEQAGQQLQEEIQSAAAHQTLEGRGKKRPRRESITGVAEWTGEAVDMRSNQNGELSRAQESPTETEELVTRDAA